MTYEVHFNRLEKTAKCGDLTVHNVEDPYFDIARLILDTGAPDSDGVFIDETGLPCLTVKSMHSCARRYRPDGVRKPKEWPQGAERGRKAKTTE